ncbi:glycosyltransferase family 4 protein [Rhizorhapis sp. SPR117]|nr:glycosyltransferase family 4 protein [Rhizorhapis sp. SPR117]
MALARNAIVPCARKPHVAFVLQGLGAGGSEHIVGLLCNHFAAQSWTVTLFAFEDRAARPYYPLDSAVRVMPLGMKSRKMSSLAGLATLWARVRLLRKGFEVAGPDIVVSFLTRTNIISLLASRGLDLPVIISERNNPALQSVGPFWERMRRWTYPRSYGLITMTRGAMDYFHPRMRKRQKVIPNPATLPAKAKAWRRDGRTMVAVGRLTAQKGFDRLLDAFARISSVHSDWRLVIWGEGADREALERQRHDLGLDDRVDLPGVSARPGGWIEDADLFILSSRFEGWGLVLGEAMAAGLPVISYDCQWGPAEMIEHEQSGLLVPEGDIEALASGLDRLCADEDLRARLALNARAAMKRYSPERILQHWQQTIEEALPKLSDADGSKLEVSAISSEC